MLVTSAIIHIRWRVALTELPPVFTPSGRKGLAVQACCRIFYASGSVLHMEADKTCVMQGHHCEHARTREAEGSAVQQSHCLALNVGAEEKWIRSSLKRALQGQLLGLGLFWLVHCKKKWLQKVFRLLHLPLSFLPIIVHSVIHNDKVKTSF